MTRESYPTRLGHRRLGLPHLPDFSLQNHVGDGGTPTTSRPGREKPQVRKALHDSAWDKTQGIPQKATRSDLQIHGAVLIPTTILNAKALLKEPMMAPLSSNDERSPGPTLYRHQEAPLR